MSERKESVRLLILDTSQNNAEELVNLLRNAGQATQAQLVESEQQLSELLNSKSWDICFANAHATVFDAFQLVTQIKQLEQDIPVILLAQEVDAETSIAALEAGMQDIVPATEHRLLLLVAQRELRNLEARRAQRKAEISQRDTEKRCRLLLDSSKDAIAYVHDGMHIYANQVYVSLFGYPDFDELEGMPLMDMVSSKDQNDLKNFLRSYANGNAESDEFSCKGVRDDDTEFEVTMLFSAARYDGETCTQILIRTGSATVNAESANQDLVTGLQSQTAFNSELEKVIEQATLDKSMHALLCIEIDNFTPLKNRLGVSATNLLLGDIGKLLRHNVGAPNILARMGDLDFGVLMLDHDPDQALAVADKLRQAIAEHSSTIADETVKLKVSIGVSLLNENTHNPAQIITKAREAATFVQQSKGGNGVHLHNIEKQDAARNEQVASLLEQAMEKQLFRLVFQPIVSLRGDSGEHYEVLLRMPDEDGKDISPANFLQTAHDKGLTRQIDRWVIEQSVTKLKGHIDKGHITHLFVNVTLESIQDKSLLPWLSETLNDLRMPGDSLIFQISETDATADLANTKEFVKGINELNCKVALTHFGRALNPFNTLRHLPLSYVKIDGSFITEVNRDESSREDLKTLVSSLHTQGKLTIAPLVDSANLLPVLWQAGINYIQGYYIQQPSGDMDYDFSTEDEDEED